MSVYSCRPVPVQEQLHYGGALFRRHDDAAASSSYQTTTSKTPSGDSPSPYAEIPPPSNSASAEQEDLSANRPTINSTKLKNSRRHSNHSSLDITEEFRQQVVQQQLTDEENHRTESRVVVMQNISSQDSNIGLKTNTTGNHTNLTSPNSPDEAGNEDKCNEDKCNGDKCKPKTKIIFIKTHKTGSTTTASIFERFGFQNKLLFVLPRGGHVLANEKPFTRKSAVPIPRGMLKTHPHYDILANHAVYTRKEMDLAIPNATYITILRDPVHQLESAFGYFEMARGMQIKSANPFQTFMQDPGYFYTHRNYSMKTRSKNGQLYDLGLPQKAYSSGDSARIFQAKIDALDKELDLVMLTEYFDESLVLMRKLLCWSYDDILYVSNGIRSKSHRFPISTTLRDKVRKWNAGDVMLYNHFNRTFWRKVREYGPDFAADLEQFRQLEKAAIDRCVDTHRFDQHDRRENKFVLNVKHSGNYCQDLLRGDVPYTTLLRNRFKELARVVQSSTNRKRNKRRTLTNSQRIYHHGRHS